MDKQLVIKLYQLVTKETPSGTVDDMIRIITKKVIAMECNYTALELQVQKYEMEIRNHIRKQQEIQIEADQLEQRIQLLQLERATIIEEAAKTLTLYKYQCNTQLKCTSPKFHTLDVTRRFSRNVAVHNRIANSQDQDKRRSSFQQYLQYRQRSQQQSQQQDAKNQLLRLNKTFAYNEQITRLKTQRKYQNRLKLQIDPNQTEITQYLDSDI